MENKEILVNKLLAFTCGIVYQSYGENYVSLERLRCLPDVICEVKYNNDLVITPYYIVNNRRMELYEFTLSIRIVKSPRGKEWLFLEETGKKTIEEIDSSVIDKLDNTYYEVLDGDYKYLASCLQRYIEYMINQEYNIINSERQKLNNGATIKDGIFFEII